MFYIYIIFNNINGKIYVGQSNNPKRWQTHLNIVKGGRKIYKSYSAIHSAINKYGAGSFEFKILHYVDASEVSDAEKYWISFFKTNNYRHGNKFGYNLTDGGEGWAGHKHSEQTKEKLRAYRVGMRASSETKNKMRNARKSKNGWLGETNPRSILNPAQVKEIKKLIADGIDNRTIAKTYNVHHSTISSIRTGARWFHIK